MSVFKRVDGPDGSFVGMVAARLDPAIFSEFFSKLDADAVALVDRAGNLYARFPAVDLLAVPPRPLRPFETASDAARAGPLGNRSRPAARPHVRRAARRHARTRHRPRPGARPCVSCCRSPGR
jgi:hypothetical protein